MNYERQKEIARLVLVMALVILVLAWWDGHWWMAATDPASDTYFDVGVILLGITTLAPTLVGVITVTRLFIRAVRA